MAFGNHASNSHNARRRLAQSQASSRRLSNSGFLLFPSQVSTETSEAEKEEVRTQKKALSPLRFENRNPVGTGKWVRLVLYGENQLNSLRVQKKNKKNNPDLLLNPSIQRTRGQRRTFPPLKDWPLWAQVQVCTLVKWRQLSSQWPHPRQRQPRPRLSQPGASR